MQRLKNILRAWLPAAVIITLLSGLTYTVVQQVLRLSANDPQIQIVEDAANALTDGQSPESVVPASKVDIATSLAPYIAVFDNSGKVIASSGLVHNQFPALPPGVFDYVRRNGEDRITWQPEQGVRSAVVITRYGGTKPGFVMVGRSLRESEARSDQLLRLVGAGGIAILFAALVAIALSEIVLPRDSRLA
jgi:hypothetical protein